MKCFCYGVPGVTGCQAASLGVETIDHSEGWFVTDLKGQFRIEPYWSASAGSGRITISHFFQFIGMSLDIRSFIRLLLSSK